MYIDRSKAIPVTGRGGPQGCGMLRITQCLDNPLTEGVEVVSLTLRPRFNSLKGYRYSFLLDTESVPGP
jgi:hypothetical protein